jgi:hypothetical protein
MEIITDTDLLNNIAEIMEEIALVEAIREGLGTEHIEREEVLNLLEDKKSELPLLS